MDTYDTIVVPTDGSDHALGAAERAGELARAFDATVHLVNAVDLWREAGPFDAGGLTEDELARFEAEARAAAEVTEAALGDAVATETAVTRGEPAAAVVEYADECDADLIAMGTRGRTGLRRYVAGSVTERVVRLADRPVLTAQVTDRAGPVDDVEAILVPTDGGEQAEDAAEHALSLARRFDATVHAANVVDVRGLSSAPDAVPTAGLIADVESAGASATERIAERAADAGVEAVTEVRDGAPASDLLTYADEEGIDLIASGTHGRSGVDRFLLGSTTERLVRHSDVPVLAVPDASETEAGRS